MDDKAEEKIRGGASLGQQVIRNVFCLVLWSTHDRRLETRTAMKTVVTNTLSSIESICKFFLPLIHFQVLLLANDCNFVINPYRVI